MNDELVDANYTTPQCKPTRENILSNRVQALIYLFNSLNPPQGADELIAPARKLLAEQINRWTTELIATYN